MTDRSRPDHDPLELEHLWARVRELEAVAAQRADREMELRAIEQRYHDLVETSPHVVWQLDRAGRVTYLNRVWESLTGFTVAETLGRRFTEFQTPDEAAGALDTLLALLANPNDEVRDFQTTFIRRDGRPVSLQVNARVLRDPHGEVIGAQGTSVDITNRMRGEEAERRRSERIIRFQEALLELARHEYIDLATGFQSIAAVAGRALRVARVSIWRFSADGREIVCDAVHDEDGRRPGPGRKLYLEGYPEYFRSVESNRIIAAEDALADPRTREFREDYLRPLGIGATLDVPVWHRERVVGLVCVEHVGGRRSWVPEECDFAVAIADGVALQLEAHARRQTEVQLRTISRAVEQSPSVVTITDPEGRILYVNPKFTEITGYRPEEVIGQNPRILKGEDNPPELFQALWQTVRAGQEWRGEFRNRKKNGETYIEQASISPIRGADGSIVSMVKVAEDMTERKRMEEQLRRDATCDSLTGLFNRRHILERLQTAVDAARRYHRPLSVCICDIDHFKAINDTFGHTVGDEVLVHFGTVLRETLRTVDLAGRYGGDEFLLVFPDTAATDVAASLERIRRRFSELRLRPGGREVACAATFGVADFQPDQHGTKDLIALADRALYQAKTRGRNRVVIIHGELQPPVTEADLKDRPTEGLPS